MCLFHPLLSKFFLLLLPMKVCIEWFYDDELFLPAIIIFVTNLLLCKRLNGGGRRKKKKIDFLNHDWIIFSSVISERSFIKQFLWSLFLDSISKTKSSSVSLPHEKKAYDCLSYAKSEERKEGNISPKKRLMIMRIKCFSFVYYYTLQHVYCDLSCFLPHLPRVCTYVNFKIWRSWRKIKTLKNWEKSSFQFAEFCIQMRDDLKFNSSVSSLKPGNYFQSLVCCFSTLSRSLNLLKSLLSSKKEVSHEFSTHEH